MKQNLPPSIGEQLVIAQINQQDYVDMPHDLYIPPEALQVFLQTFEGPLDLLLYLIRKQNLDILAIPINKITEQYISYINTMKVFNIDLAAEYLLMAATLLEIKSRLLLPAKISDNPDEEVEDPTTELIRRLVEYEKIKLASEQLNRIPQAGRDFNYVNLELEPFNTTPPQVAPEDLQKAIQKLILKAMLNNTTHHINKQELSVREHMSLILKQLQPYKLHNFFDLFDVTRGAPYVVVSFIAILELCKESVIEISSGYDDNQKKNIYVCLKSENE